MKTKGKPNKRHTRNLWSLRSRLSGISPIKCNFYGRNLGEIADIPFRFTTDTESSSAQVL